MATIRNDAFPGFSLADEPASLPAGSLIEGSRDIDLTRTLGALAKRRGINAVIDSLGTGGIKGIHTYRTAGERVLFGHGTSLHRLVGEGLNVAEDGFDGILNGVAVNAGALVLDASGAGEEIFSQQPMAGTWDSAADGHRSRAFKTGPGVYLITSIKVYVRAYTTTPVGLTMKVYSDAGLSNLLDSVSLGSLSYNEATYKTGVFATPIDVQPETEYYLVVDDTTSGRDWSIRKGSGDDTYGYPGFYYEAYTEYPYIDSGDWLSPVYDLGQSPAVNTLEWTENIESSTTVAVKARGSVNGDTWNDWQTIAETGDALPRTRYIQLQIFLTGGAYTPSVSALSIVYESYFTDSEELATGLSGNMIRFCDFDGVCYFTDGGRPQRYDGTAITPVGIDPPETAPTIAAGDAGGLTGDYYALVTFVNEYGAESNAGPASTKLTVSAKKINWSSIPTGPAGTTERNLYRTKAGGTAYYLAATIANNTATTYTGDNVPDSKLIDPLPTDNDVPPECSIVYEHKNYMMYAAGNKLYFSKAKLPDSVPANAAKVFPGDILGLRTYQNALIVSGERFTHAIVGDIWDKEPVEIGGLDNTIRVVISNSEGCVSHEGMCEIFTTSGDYLVIPTLTDLKFLSPGYQEASLRTSTFTRDIQPLFAYLANKDGICAVYDKERLIVALTYHGEDSEAETNNIILVFDTRTLKWSPPWHINCAGFTHAFNRLFIADSNLGQIHEFEAGSDDNGSNVHAVAVLRQESMDVPELKKKLLNLRVAALPGSNTSKLKLRPSIDGIETTIMPGNVPSWGRNISPKKKIYLPRGYEYQLTIEDNSRYDWQIPYVITEFERGE